MSADPLIKDMLEDIRDADEPIVAIESDDGGEFKGAFQRVLDSDAAQVPEQDEV